MTEIVAPRDLRRLALRLSLMPSSVQLARFHRDPELLEGAVLVAARGIAHATTQDALFHPDLVHSRRRVARRKEDELTRLVLECRGLDPQIYGRQLRGLLSDIRGLRAVGRQSPSPVPGSPDGRPQ